MSSSNNGPKRMTSQYIPSVGEDVWQRQGIIRNVRKEADSNGELRDIAYQQLLEATARDRELCESAFEVEFISHRIEGTLDQQEVAEDIRLQAENFGIPWRGLTPEELFLMLKASATEQREQLIDLIHNAETGQNNAIDLNTFGVNRLEELDQARDITVSKINDYTNQIIEMLRERERQLIRNVDDAINDHKADVNRYVENAAKAKSLSGNIIHVSNIIKKKDDLGMIHEMESKFESLQKENDELNKLLKDAKKTKAKELGNSSESDETKVPDLAAVVKFRPNEYLLDSISNHSSVISS